MKAINYYAGWSEAPSQPVGLFKVYGFHQHRIRGPRYYAPNCIPRVSYGPPSHYDMVRGEHVFATAREAIQALPSRRALGKHGQRGIKVLVPDDFPSEYWQGEEFKATWAAVSPNSPYNDEVPRAAPMFRER